ncbi:glycogen synthase GlgA [Paralimibaculum aggregatum]|uniref:Glycogen synthase n=1 Tax=Paralimibaculum aggregatum TaxID=3036245 RepID=A0ABQ6LN60_9RHOB|nr:glycogen synthase GlgA [Limibaculum sp. NKW23]GMG82633.1 glycogen synthase GlgA [Limibaculum sp. NKW23]
MKVLFVASECAPFVKTGGLADVIGAVPKTLAALGAEVRILLPAYPALREHAAAADTVLAIDDLFGGPAALRAVTAEGLDLLLLDAPHLFDRPGNIYLGPDGADWADNHLRFGALCRIGARVALDGVAGWAPDILHAHDWQAGLIPVYLRQAGGAVPKSVVTVHNIAFQGLFDAAVCAELGVEPESFVSERAEYFGKLGFLKGGLACCDRITTVSPTYARELLTPEFGMGLHGVLQARSADLSGILNGIDLDAWDPGADPSLAATYTARSLKKKAANRAAIEQRFGLDAAADGDGPLFCVVSRLTEQKGLDLLLAVLPGLVARGARLALLGSGDKSLEAGFVAAAHRFKGSVGVEIGYDEPLSHLMQGGSDAILIPSRFEPCGLTQLYGLRYGTLPVVARTGGLADTVIDANEAAILAGCATGVQFAPVTAQALDQAIARTCELYRQPALWQKMMRQAMKHPVGWDQSARAYLALYAGLLGEAPAEPAPA